VSVIVSGLLLISAVIHLLPLSGAISTGRLEALTQAGVSRELHVLTAQTIAEDCADLRSLCDVHGSFGRAAFPQLADPCARAAQMMVPLNDGNTRDVYLETEDAWVALLFDTS
jgi:hypothetical protein